MHNLLPPKLLTNLSVKTLTKEQIIHLKNQKINGFIIELESYEKLDSIGKLIGQIRSACNSAAIVLRLPDNKLKVISSAQKEFYLDEVINLRSGKEQVLNDIIVSSSTVLSRLTVGAFIKIGNQLKLKVIGFDKEGNSLQTKVVRSGAISKGDRVVSKDINFSLNSSANTIKQYLQLANEYDVDFIFYAPNSPAELKVLSSTFHKYGQIIDTDIFNHDFVTEHLKVNLNSLISLNVNEISAQSDAVQALEFLSKASKFTQKNNISMIFEYLIKESMEHDLLMSLVGFSRYPIDSLLISYRTQEDNLDLVVNSHISVTKRVNKAINVRGWLTHEAHRDHSDPILKSMGLNRVDKVVIISSQLDLVKDLNRVDHSKELYFITNDPTVQKRAALFRNVTAYYLKDFPRSYDNLLEKSILHLFTAGVIDISENLMVISGSTYNKSAKDGRAEIIEAKTFLLA